MSEAREEAKEVLTGIVNRGGFRDDDGVWHEVVTIADVADADRILAALEEAGFTLAGPDEVVVPRSFVEAGRDLIFPLSFEDCICDLGGSCDKCDADRWLANLEGGAQ